MVAIDETDAKWSEMVESIRTDVECTFGRIKGWFRVLKYGFSFNDAAVCQDFMLSCCILHDMLAATTLWTVGR